MKHCSCLLFAAAPAIATSAPPDLAVTRIDDAPGWFLCDGVDAPYVALVGKASAAGAIRIGLLAKARPAVAPMFAVYHVGAPDPGAGQVYRPLARSGRAAGHLHAFNPGALADARQARTPPFTSVEIGRRRMQCRWMADTRFVGIAARRSVIVREVAPGRLIYESFDYGDHAAMEMPDGVQRTTRPSQRVTGGRLSTTAGVTRLDFANAGYRYTITVEADGPATLAVTRGGRTIGSERLIAYTLAR